MRLLPEFKMFVFNDPGVGYKGKEQYYPVNDEVNTKRFKQYQALADEEEGILFGGRLAEYRYYDMHQVIGSAFVKARQELEVEVIKQ